MTRDEIFNYHAAYHSDYNKMKSMLNKVILDHEAEIEALKFSFNKKTSQELQVEVASKKELIKNEQTEIGRVVSLFDVKRKSIQANFVRQEYKNIDGEYLLRKHLYETKRTAQMFLEAVQWLFSNNPKAAFHREYIMNIGHLIKHFNALEHQAMHSAESVQFSEEAQVWANVYKKKGFSDDEILEKLREGGYLE
ncbi:MAG: hypothetical protein Q9M32_04270 [Sulfurimonas sp.]|nr:hypothetical protein [Sulfurimonas sp.]MDQ7061974.1 hypothetical protein [Sulfurimonas sp.]